VPSEPNECRDVVVHEAFANHAERRGLCLAAEPCHEHLLASSRHSVLFARSWRRPPYGTIAQSTTKVASVTASNVSVIGR
jgi:hypothetical protein